ncbi:MAG: glycoside hydrolase N-terminal domain-containing protein [Candidatus Sigynarchaeota archaeon]
MARESSPLVLWYKQPANAWTEALPIGNGRIGGMIFGHVDEECIQLNECTFWSGHPYDKSNPKLKDYLPVARKLVFEGKLTEAEKIIEEHMGGPRTQSYQPLGYLFIEPATKGTPSDYRRYLDITSAIAGVEYNVGGTKYTREMFASAPNNVMVIALASSDAGGLAFKARLDSEHPITIRGSGKGLGSLLAARGQAPDNVVPNYENSDKSVTYEKHEGMHFEIQLGILACDGETSVNGSELQVRGASRAVLLLAAATSFSGFDKEPATSGVDPAKACETWLGAAKKMDYEKLKERHVADYSALFGRVAIDLGTSPDAELPTDERLKKIAIPHAASNPLTHWLLQAEFIEYDREAENEIQKGFDDPQLVALYFQYGRYLLICSSRPGGQPANLQGIWNDLVRPPWSSNYTMNINIEMNYWPAEPCNLPECVEPLVQFIKELQIAGTRTAKVDYGLPGWVCNHNSDLWRTCNPIKGWTGWQWWPMGGAWICRHLWEHYAFTKDKAFLKETYPIMKGAAEFLLAYMAPDPSGKYLVSAPSTSPENAFLIDDNKRAASCMASTMDASITWDLFTNLVKASKILDIDKPFRDTLETAISKIYPYQISSRYAGCLQEWDKDYKEAEPGHRHMSHLYGWHPGNRIILRRQPDLAEAVRKSIERRLAHGGGGTGWSGAWLVNHFARLEDAEGAYNKVLLLLRRSIYPNMFDAHPPFQIDGNFGGTAGIAEMLLQSHGGQQEDDVDEISLLPALPKQWPKGYVRGLVARGAYQVDIEWSGGLLETATIKSRVGGKVRLRAKCPVKITSDSDVKVLEAKADHVVFQAEPETLYHVYPFNR